MDNNSAHLLAVLLDKTDDTDRVTSSLNSKFHDQGFELATWRGTL